MSGYIFEGTLQIRNGGSEFTRIECFFPFFVPLFTLI